MSLTFKMVLSLVDQASSRMNQIARNADRMANRVSASVQKMSRGNASAFANMMRPEMLQKGVDRMERGLNRARSRLMDAAAMGAIALAPVLNIGRFEHQLAHFGNVADMTGQQLKRIEDGLRETAPKVNQLGSDLLKGLDFLMAKGLNTDQATGAINTIGKAATATGASVEDLSKASYASISNLEIPVDRIGNAIDKMAAAGKQGGFELRDMAQYFPGLTAAARNLGMTGEGALVRMSSALQIAVKGASDPSQAANNFMNFLVKMTSAETTRKFKKIGIDIRAELASATAKGLDPMEYMMVRLHDLHETNKDLVGDIYTDMQVQQFLKPMIAGLDEYARIRDETMNASGVIDADYNRVMNTMVERWKGFVIELDNATAKGGGLASVIKGLLIDMTGLVRSVNEFSAAHPELVGWLVKGAAALVAMSIAGRLLSYAFFLVGGGALQALKTLAGLARFAGQAGAALGRLSKGAVSGLAAVLRGSLSGAFSFLRIVATGALSMIAAAGWPVVLVIAAIAAAVFGLWTYWDRFSSFVSGFGAGLYEAIKPGLNALQNGWASAVDGMRSGIGELAQAVGADAKTAMAAFDAAFDFSGFLESLKSVGAAVADFFANLFEQETLTDAQRADITASGHEIGKLIGDALMRAVDTIGAIGTQIIEALKNAVLSGVAGLSSIGTDIVEAIRAGLEDAWGSLENWLSDKIAGLKSMFDFNLDFNLFGGGAEAAPVAAPGITPETQEEPAADRTSDPTPARATKGDRKPVPSAPTRFERIPSPAEFQAQTTAQNGALAAALERLADAERSKATGTPSTGNADTPDVVEVPQTVDQSRHVTQSNVFHVKVIGGPAASGQAAASSLAAASSRALRDTD